MAATGRTIPFTRTSTRKLDFRIIINLFNIILFGLLGAGAAIKIGYDGTHIMDTISITSPAISLLWTTTATTLLLTSSHHHPAIDLTLDAICWLTFWILGAFLIAQVAVSEGLIMCSPSYDGVPNTTFCGPDGARKWNLDAAACAFMLVNGLIHLVFFAVACDEVKRWRRGRWGHKRELVELDRNESLNKI